MNSMVIAIEITLLGMGLVFAAILLLWCLMSLLTFVTADREAASSRQMTGPDSSQSAAVMESELRAQAAAVAVALALAEQQSSCVHPLATPPTVVVSAWQLGMRTRQMYQKGVPLREKSRKTG
jgi:Na+-transporting methylmalonyl-CoA/oxaloacetate decarboxylase gamma subunit